MEKPKSIQWPKALHDPLSPNCRLSNLLSCSFPPYSLLQLHRVPCCSLNVPGPLPPQGLYTCSSLSGVLFPQTHVHMGVRSVQAHRAPCLEGPCAWFNVLPLPSWNSEHIWTRGPIFSFALGPTNYTAGLVDMVASLLASFKSLLGCPLCKGAYSGYPD